MKVTKVKQGEYKITVHGFVFTLEKLYGSKNWTLYNAQGTAINQCEVKYGMLQLMRDWTAKYAEEESNQEFCTFA